MSLAFATATGAPPPAAAARNAFPEEPRRVASGAGGSGAWPWVLAVALASVGAVAGTGWWAFQRTRMPAASVPTTAVDVAAPAAEAEVVAPEDSVSAIEQIVVDAPPVVAPAPPPSPVTRPTVRPPAVATPSAGRADPQPRPRAPVRRVDDADDEPGPQRSAARPVGPVGGGPASACYGRTGYVLDSCISAQCRQPHYRNHPGCRGS